MQDLRYWCIYPSSSFKWARMLFQVVGLYVAFIISSVVCMNIWVLYLLIHMLSEFLVLSLFRDLWYCVAFLTFPSPALSSSWNCWVWLFLALDCNCSSCAVAFWSFAVGIGSYWLATWNFELEYDCCCYCLFPQGFTFSLRNDGHSYISDNVIGTHSDRKWWSQTACGDPVWSDNAMSCQRSPASFLLPPSPPNQRTHKLEALIRVPIRVHGNFFWPFDGLPSLQWGEWGFKTVTGFLKIKGLKGLE